MRNAQAAETVLWWTQVRSCKRMRANDEATGRHHVTWWRSPAFQAEVAKVKLFGLYITMRLHLPLSHARHSLVRSIWWHLPSPLSPHQ